MSQEKSKISLLDVLGPIDAVPDKYLALRILFPSSPVNEHASILSPEEINEQVLLRDNIQTVIDTYLLEIGKINEFQEYLNDIQSKLNRIDSESEFAEQIPIFHFLESIVEELSSLSKSVDAFDYLSQIFIKSELTQEEINICAAMCSNFDVQIPIAMDSSVGPLQSGRNNLVKFIQRTLDHIPQVHRKNQAQLKQTISVLRAKQKKVVQQESANFLETIQAQIEDIKQKLQPEILSEITSELLQLQLELEKIKSIQISEHIDPLIQLILDFRQEVGIYLEREIQKLEKDSVETRDTFLEKILSTISSQNLITKETHEFIKSKCSELDITPDAAESIELASREKQSYFFNMNDITNVRRRLYEYYKNQPKERKKEYLRQAVSLLEQLTEYMSNAFFNAYDAVWKEFFESDEAYQEIKFDSDAATRVFFKEGFTVTETTQIVVKTFENIAESHNKVVGILKSISDQSSEALGETLFKGYLKGMNSQIRDSYGKVSLDTRPPITSIRFICEDVRDYMLLSLETNLDDYVNTAVGNAATQSGGKKTPDKKFVIENTAIELPVTVINAASGLDSHFSISEVILHEDAHQAITYRSAGEERKSMDSKQIQSQLELDLVASLSRQVDIGVTNKPWYRELQNQLLFSSLPCRDELQAYLTDGSSIERIKRELSDTGPNALYEYVASTEFRLRTVEEIKRTSANEDEAANNIAEFKNAVFIAKDVYDKFLKRYIQRISQMLTKLQSKYGEDASNRVGLLVRHTTPYEFFAITRYMPKESSEVAADSKSELTQREIFDCIESSSDVVLQDLIQDYPSAIATFIRIYTELANNIPIYFYGNCPEIGDIVRKIDTSVEGLRNVIKLLNMMKKAALVWNTTEQKALSLFSERMNNFSENEEDSIETMFSQMSAFYVNLKAEN